MGKLSIVDSMLTMFVGSLSVVDGMPTMLVGRLSVVHDSLTGLVGEPTRLVGPVMTVDEEQAEYEASVS